LLAKFWPRMAFAAVLVVALGVGIWASNLKPNPNPQQQMAFNVEKPAEEFLTEREAASKDSPSRPEPELKKSEPALTLARRSEGPRGVKSDLGESDLKLQSEKREKGLTVASAPPVAPPASRPTPALTDRLDSFYSL